MKENKKSKEGKQSKNAITLELKVTPGAKSNAFTGLQGDRLKVRIAAKAVDGAANEALLQFIAAVFHVPLSCVSLVSGKTARLKTVSITAKPGAGETDGTALLRLKAIAQKLSQASAVRDF
jgi:uncharacterized protein (TIGR00251 family)